MGTALHLRVVAAVFSATTNPSGLSGRDLAVCLRDIVGLVQSDVRSLDTNLGVEHLRFLIVQVLSRIGRLEFEHFDEHVKPCRQ